VAAAHHRLAWIHPFLDGNGRVARLMSHAMLLEMLDTGAIWSAARGLARNVQAYEGHLIACDQTLRNDLDGRGNLSEEALAAFTNFFLRTCIDQVTFMETLVQPDRLRARIVLWADEEIKLDKIPPKSGAVLEAVLFRGELPRAAAASVVGTGERQARRVVSALIERGVLVSNSARAIAPRLSGHSRITVDAGPVPRESRIKVPIPTNRQEHTSRHCTPCAFQRYARRRDNIAHGAVC
jgi:Fic family protein